MKVQTGYLYHIKDEFFDIVDDDTLMTNHERGTKRKKRKLITIPTGRTRKKEYKYMETL